MSAQYNKNTKVTQIKLVDNLWRTKECNGECEKRKIPREQCGFWHTKSEMKVRYCLNDYMGTCMTEGCEFKHMDKKERIFLKFPDSWNLKSCPYEKRYGKCELKPDRCSYPHVLTDKDDNDYTGCDEPDCVESTSNVSVNCNIPEGSNGQIKFQDGKIKVEVNTQQKESTNGKFSYAAIIRGIHNSEQEAEVKVQQPKAEQLQIEQPKSDSTKSVISNSTKILQEKPKLRKTKNDKPKPEQFVIEEPKVEELVKSSREISDSTKSEISNSAKVLQEEPKVPVKSEILQEEPKVPAKSQILQEEKVEEADLLKPSVVRRSNTDEISASKPCKITKAMSLSDSGINYLAQKLAEEPKQEEQVKVQEEIQNTDNAAAIQQMYYWQGYGVAPSPHAKKTTLEYLEMISEQIGNESLPVHGLELVNFIHVLIAKGFIL